MRHAIGAVYKRHRFENSGSNDAEVWDNAFSLRLKSIEAPVTVSRALEESPLAENNQRFAPLQQEIPDLPGSIHTLNGFWQKGSQLQGFCPVYVYSNVGMRRAIILGFAKKTWASGGKKRAFQTYLFFALHVAKCNRQTQAIYAVGSDST